MTESKSQDKYYPYGLKHESFENFNWPPIEPEFDDFRSSNFALMNKMANRGQIFGDFGQTPLNPEAVNDQISLPPQSENQNPIIDQTDQTNRMHTNFPIFNEKLLSNNNNPSELGLNPMKNQYSSLVMNNINKLPPYALPNNYYFPFNVPNIELFSPSKSIRIIISDDLSHLNFSKKNPSTSIPNSIILKNSVFLTMLDMREL